jgi:hypothetical protein
MPGVSLTAALANYRQLYKRLTAPSPTFNALVEVHSKEAVWGANVVLQHTLAYHQRPAAHLIMSVAKPMCI